MKRLKAVIRSPANLSKGSVSGLSAGTHELVINPK